MKAQSKMVMEARDHTEVSVDPTGMVRIEQIDAVGNDPAILLLPPSDIPRLMAMLEKAQAQAEEILRAAEHS